MVAEQRGLMTDTLLTEQKTEIRGISDAFLLKRHHKSEETGKFYTWRKIIVFQEHLNSSTYGCEQ